jgi:hypothetical protein
VPLVNEETTSDYCMSVKGMWRLEFIGSDFIKNNHMVSLMSLSLFLFFDPISMQGVDPVTCTV